LKKKSRRRSLVGYQLPAIVRLLIVVVTLVNIMIVGLALRYLMLPTDQQLISALEDRLIEGVTTTAEIDSALNDLGILDDCRDSDEGMYCSIRVQISNRNRRDLDSWIGIITWYLVVDLTLNNGVLQSYSHGIGSVAP
jgi:hypothetical protein